MNDGRLFSVTVPMPMEELCFSSTSVFSSRASISMTFCLTFAQTKTSGHLNCKPCVSITMIPSSASIGIATSSSRDSTTSFSLTDHHVSLSDEKAVSLLYKSKTCKSSEPSLPKILVRSTDEKCDLQFDVFTVNKKQEGTQLSEPDAGMTFTELEQGQSVDVQDGMFYTLAVPQEDKDEKCQVEDDDALMAETIPVVYHGASTPRDGEQLSHTVNLPTNLGGSEYGKEELEEDRDMEVKAVEDEGDNRSLSPIVEEGESGSERETEIAVSQDAADPQTVEEAAREALRPPLVTCAKRGRPRTSRAGDLSCQHCGKVFRAPSLLERHERSHTREKPHACSVCFKSFARLDYLKVHAVTHTGEENYKCTTCGEAFRYKSQLRDHVKSHSGALLTCDVCGKGFPILSRLQAHRNTHQDRKPHVCESCDETFSSRAQLLRHTKVRHGADGPPQRWDSGICGGSLTSKQSYDRHMMIHTETYEYRCSTCGKRFRERQSYLQHRDTHTGARRYSCHECGKRFRQASCLREHAKVHQTNRPVVHCPVCRLPFTGPKSLKVHLVKIHSLPKDSRQQGASDEPSDVKITMPLDLPDTAGQAEEKPSEVIKSSSPTFEQSGDFIVMHDLLADGIDGSVDLANHIETLGNPTNQVESVFDSSSRFGSSAEPANQLDTWEDETSAIKLDLPRSAAVVLHESEDHFRSTNLI